MKFGKSYMETLASPSFPKEWREGAIEYKQLKKLINGVVAELESLGLGADVLRDLIVPPGEEGADGQQQSESEQDDDDDAIEALRDDHEVDEDDELSGTDKTRGLYSTSAGRAMIRRASAPAHAHRNRSLSDTGAISSGDASIGSSADDCDQCATELHHLRVKDSAGHSDSPAAEWVAHIAHAKHSRRRKAKHHHGHKDGTTTVSSGNEAGTSAAPTSPDAKAGRRNVEYLRPPGSRDSSIGHMPSFNEGIFSSGDENEHSSSAKLNKRDLEELRRRRASSVEVSRRLSRPSSAGTYSTSKPSSDDRVHDWGGHAWRERPGLRPTPASSPAAAMASAAQKAREGAAKSVQHKWVQGRDGRRARAEYELGGTPERPIPHIRLFVESPVQSGDELSDGGEADSEGDESDDSEDDEDEKDAGEADFKLPKVNVAFDEDEEGHDDDEARFTELSNTTPRASMDNGIKPLQGQPRSPILRPEQGGKPAGKRKMRTREIVIPLNADTEFLDTLTGALSNLSTLQQQQREQFQESTEAVCKAVSEVASPYGNKHDLYVWREIFALWTELQIFESQRERDRGELSVDETEARLKKFAEELAKRGWNTEAFQHDANLRAAATAEMTGASDGVESEKGKGKKFTGKLAKWRHHQSNGKFLASTGALPMKDPRSIAALEEFLKLNLALLDVKKFQRVNVEAARKILKKHDKRTALTASSDLGAFVEQQERMRATAASAAAGVGISGLVNIPERSVASNSALVHSHGAATHPSLAALLPSSTSALLSASLPHILLSLMTTTLLPILPSIDDYSCAICTGVAWRPIKLDCTHLFCIRCLVKLQKQGKNDCPLCRAPNVVGNADERNLDKQAAVYMKQWFPREVAEKDKDNEKDRHKEEMLELGLTLDNEKCCVA